MRKILVLLPLVAMFFSLSAGTPESSRILVHTLNYVGQDYQHAVANGKIISEDEYKEMLEFCENAEKYFAENSATWNPEDAKNIEQTIDSVVLAVKAKESPTRVTALCLAAKLKIIGISGLKTYPSEAPNILNGKKIFSVECVKCHGENGFGDGVEGLELNPKPRNFHDNERMKYLSASHIFNTVRLGVEGTGMRAIPYLEDDEVWDVAFYVLSLRSGNEETSNASAKINLEQLATLSDLELMKQFSLSESQVAAIRKKEHKVSQDRFVKVAEKHLLKAKQLFSEGKNNEAFHYASLAYLEGIEPIELHLNATDPELKIALERQMTNIRKLIRENGSKYDLSDSIDAAQQTLIQVSQLLEKREYSFFMALLMSISILLREGLEAFLVIMVILSILKVGDFKRATFWVHIGWIGAVLLGVVLWFITKALFPNEIHNLEMVEGFISMLAVLMLLYIGFWLHGKSEVKKWKDYVSGLVNGIMQNGSIVGLTSLSFFVVFREVFESVLFVSALDIESGGKQTEAILLGVLIAFLIIFLFAFLVMRFSTKLPIPTLFKFSSFVMAVLAVILTGKGIHSFQEVGLVGVHSLPVVRIELLGVFPTLETCAAQLVAATLAFAIWKWSAKK